MLYPLVRSMSRTFGELTEIAGQVSAGRFGRTLGSGRPGELGALVDAFDEMSRKLAEAERLDTRLLHDVSHEFRSPLGRIQVMAESLRDHPEEAEERIRGITQEVALLDRLVGDLVETARIESEARSPEWEEMSLVAWARERKTFGKRLADHQVIRHKIAQMKQKLNATQAYIRICYEAIEAGNANPGDIALLKVQASETMEFCAREAMQILGGIGYMRGNRVERIYREVRVNAIGGGSEEIMRDLAARQYGL